MNKKYTYEDWVKNIPVPNLKGKVSSIDYFGELKKRDGISESELKKIREKQIWTYDEGLKIDVKYRKQNFIKELKESVNPERYYQYMLKYLEDWFSDQENQLDLVMRRVKDYYSITGATYNQVRGILTGKRKIHMIVPLHFRSGRWGNNTVFATASYLNLENFIKSKSFEDHLESKGTSSNRGRKKNEHLTIKMTEGFVDDYKKKFKGMRDKFHQDGSIIKNRLYEYINDRVNVEKEVVSRATIHRRINDVLD